MEVGLRRFAVNLASIETGELERGISAQNSVLKPSSYATFNFVLAVDLYTQINGSQEEWVGEEWVG